MPDAENADENKIGDEEILYRSIKQQRDEIVFEAEGKLRVSSQAFADREKQPSLYRHHLCDAPPYSNPPRMGPDQAVVFLLALKIREGAGRIEHGAVTYVVDVKPDTSKNQHRSHAIIIANPGFTNEAFKKLKIRLARLVEDWAILPDDAFIEQLKAESK